MSYLSIQDVASLSATCRILRVIGKQPVLWEIQFKRDFSDQYEVAKAGSSIDQAEEGAEESKVSESVAGDASPIDWHKEYCIAFQETYGHLDKSDQLLVMAIRDGDLDALNQKVLVGALTFDSLCSLVFDDRFFLHPWFFTSTDKVVKFLFDKLVIPDYQRELTAEQQDEGLSTLDVTKADRHGNTVLHYAVVFGQGEKVEELIRLGADANVAGKNDVTALIFAILDGHNATVAQLIAAQANVNATLRMGSTPLMWAACQAQDAIVAQLIAAGADVNATDGRGMMALMWAANYGQDAIVAQLIAAEADVNATDDHGMTALMWANNGYDTIVAQLIAAGADVNAITDHGMTALMWAANYGHDAIVAQLIAAGADVNAADVHGVTALRWAASYGHDAIEAQLITTGTDVNAITDHGMTALMWANNGYDAIVVQLIAAGANVNATDDRGATALMWVANNGHGTIVAKLIAAGANVNVVKLNGSTALTLATDNGHEGIVTQLNFAGAGIKECLDMLDTGYEQANKYAVFLEGSKVSFLKKVLGEVFKHQYEIQGQPARSKATLVDALNYAAQLSFSQRRLLGITNEPSNATRALQRLAGKVQNSEDIQSDFVLHYNGHSLSSRGHDRHPGAAFVAVLGMCGT